MSEKNEMKFKLNGQAQESNFRDPKQYLLPEKLGKAVQVALTLGQPLLLTGEPGTGKTQLSYKVAQLLHEQTKGQFLEKPLEFYTKTTSAASDLFYTYDALGHFHDANLQKTAQKTAPDARDYIQLQALGKAIALSNGEFLESGQPYLKNASPQSSVVLIDEIDKAPRDFPNDILNEIEDFRFRIKETGEDVRQGKEKRIVVIMTSNSEKNLPDAFLRRCVFYHIPFPSADQLFEIVSTRMAGLVGNSEDKVREAIGYFGKIRERVSKKPPATAELLAWLHVLELEGFFKDKVDFDNLSPDQKAILEFSYPILIKFKDDLMD